MSSFILSGETLANRGRIVQGQMDVKLSEEGRNQAALLFNYWSSNNRTFDLIYSSDLSRAFETCKTIVGPDLQDKIVVDERLRERSYGVLEGVLVHELRAAEKEAGFNEKNYSSYTPEGAESVIQVRDRIRLFCSEHLVNVVDNGYKVLLVTHGGVIREFFRFFRDSLRCHLSSESEPYRVTPNTGVSTFRISYRSNKLVSAECLQIHDVSHLPKSAEGGNGDQRGSGQSARQSSSDDPVINPCDLISSPPLEAL